MTTLPERLAREALEPWTDNREWGGEDNSVFPGHDDIGAVSRVADAVRAALDEAAKVVRAAEGDLAFYEVNDTTSMDEPSFAKIAAAIEALKDAP